MGLPFQIFILGLLTVFLVLLVVAGTGNAIIWVTNRFFTPPPLKMDAPGVETPAARTGKIAAVTAAVYTMTKGKGKVVRIEKHP